MSLRRLLSSSPILLALALAAIATLAAWGLGRVAHSAPRPATSPGQPAIVSLAPAITETLFAIGAGDRVVAVSDHCDFPTAATRLPRVGGGLTPNYEQIARLAPSLILTDRYGAARSQQLGVIARTEPLPWLTLEEVTSSIRQLGALTGREAAAQKLAARMHARLSVPAPPDAPRVLLAYGSAALALGEVWFIQRNSLHGAALRAAGGRNAVARDIRSSPRMSLEELVALDPDVIIVLSSTAGGPAPEPDALLRPWQALDSLRAVTERRIAVVPGIAVHAMGPRILDLVDRLSRVIQRTKVGT